MDSKKYLYPYDMEEFVKQENDFIVFQGDLQQLMEKVETGEMISRLHTPRCVNFLLHITLSVGSVM
jgi:hypothetical protein